MDAGGRGSGGVPGKYAARGAAMAAACTAVRAYVFGGLDRARAGWMGGKRKAHVFYLLVEARVTMCSGFRYVSMTQNEKQKKIMPHSPSRRTNKL